MYVRTCSRWGLTVKRRSNEGLRRRTLQSRSQDDLTERHRQKMVAKRRRSVAATSLAPVLTQDTVGNVVASRFGYYKTRRPSNSSGPPSAPRRLQESSKAATSGCVAQSACTSDPCKVLGVTFKQCGESCSVRTVCDTCTRDGAVALMAAHECTLRAPHHCASTPVPLSVALLHRLAAAHIISPKTTDWGGVAGYWQCCEVIGQVSIEECVNDPEEPLSSKAFTITTHMSCDTDSATSSCIAVMDAPYIWIHQPHWPTYVQSNSFTFAFNPEICRSADLESPCDNVGMVPCGEHCVPRPEGTWEVAHMAEQGLYSDSKKHCDPRGSVVADFAACENMHCDCKHAGSTAFDECCVRGGNGTSCPSGSQQADPVENNTGSYNQDYYYDASSDSSSGSGSWADEDYISYSGSYDQSELWTGASSESGSWSTDQLRNSDNVERDKCVPLSDDPCTQYPGDRCGALGSFVTCRPTSSTVVQVEISFAIDVGVISESAESLHTFKQSVIDTIAVSLGIAPGRVRVISIEAGSVIVVVEITGAARDSQEMTPVAAAVALQAKLADSNDSIHHVSDVFAAALGVVGMSVVTYGDLDENTGDTVSLAFDCAGVVGGNAVRDHCGTCDDDMSTDCVADCAGVWGGSSSLDRCGECAGDDSCVDCRGVPFGEATYDDCSTPHLDSEREALGLSDRSTVAGGEASTSGDIHSLLGAFAVCVAASLLALAVMCILKPQWWPVGFATAAMCPRNCCSPLWACLFRLPRRLKHGRARSSSKVFATTRQRAYQHETGSSSDDEGGVDDDAVGQQCVSKLPSEPWASGSTLIAKAGRLKQNDWRTHTPELQQSSGLPYIDPISMGMLHKVDWIAAKARFKEV